MCELPGLLGLPCCPFPPVFSVPLGDRREVPGLLVLFGVVFGPWPLPWSAGAMPGRAQAGPVIRATAEAPSRILLKVIDQLPLISGSLLFYLVTVSEPYHDPVPASPHADWSWSYNASGSRKSGWMAMFCPSAQTLIPPDPRGAPQPVGALVAEEGWLSLPGLA